MPPDHVAPPGSAARPVVRYDRGHARQDDDRLAEEVPVAVHVDGRSFAVMMASPLDLDDFAVGFALTEGLVDAPADIESIDVAAVLEGITVDIRTRVPERRQQAAERNLPGRSGCGICGTRELEDLVRRPAPVGLGPRVTPVDIEHALASLRESQPLNAFTGSVHAAAWAQPDGMLVLVREDVGRHNALDKLIGALVKAGTDVSDGFAVVTSRASYEMVTKAATAGMAVLVAISAPTALAVSLAQQCGLTLVGFARPGRFNVYSRPDRVVDGGPA